MKHDVSSDKSVRFLLHMFYSYLSTWCAYAISSIYLMLWHSPWHVRYLFYLYFLSDTAGFVLQIPRHSRQRKKRKSDARTVTKKDELSIHPQQWHEVYYLTLIFRSFYSSGLTVICLICTCFGLQNYSYVMIRKTWRALLQ